MAAILEVSANQKRVQLYSRVKIPLRKSLYYRLAFCLIAEQKWRARGDSLWAANYRDEVGRLRRRLRPVKRVRVCEDLRSSFLAEIREALDSSERETAARY